MCAPASLDRFAVALFERFWAHLESNVHLACLQAGVGRNCFGVSINLEFGVVAIDMLPGPVPGFELTP